MTEYGYIENGYLRSKILEPIINRSTNKNGELEENIITIVEQISNLSPEWKPVDLIDETKMQCEDGYVIRIIPYDAGDHIAYEYRKVFDIQKVNKDIEYQKSILSGSDYKVSKCYEASLLGEPLPYDINELHTMRQAARDKVNELEGVLYGMDK